MAGAPREQSGDEAARPARAPAGTRLGLALFGLAMSLIGILVLGATRRWWGVLLFALIAAIAVLDAGVQVRRIRRRRR